MTIQQDVKEMTKTLAGLVQAECDKELAEEVAYYLAEMKEVAERYQEGFKLLEGDGKNRGESLRLLKELHDLIFDRAIVHAKDLRRPVEELQAVLEEDNED